MSNFVAYHVELRPSVRDTGHVVFSVVQAVGSEHALLDSRLGVASCVSELGQDGGGREPV